jgi:glycosyltransferase involved in cell wall biosynthesis
LDDTVSELRPRLLYVVESSTDVRLVDGLARSFDLSVLARTIVGGVTVSHPPASPVPVRRTPPGRVRFAWAVFREILARRREVDVVLAQGYGVGALAANLAGRIARIPTTMLVCSPLEEYYLCRRADSSGASPRFRASELALLRIVAWINARVGERYVALSEHLATVVHGHGTRRPVEICAVYGVDTQVFTPPAKTKADLRRELALPAEGALVFFPSRIAPEKDVDTLLEAFSLLVAEGRDLFLLNTSGAHAELEQRAARLGLGERLIARPALDPRSELPAHYQAADLCVQASRAEGLGFVPLESLACGTPVVAADVGGLRETVGATRTGWTYRPGDATGLARAIAAALDAAGGETRVAAGRELVETAYESGVVFARLRAVLAGRASRSLQEHAVGEVGSVV